MLLLYIFDNDPTVLGIFPRSSDWHVRAEAATELCSRSSPGFVSWAPRFENSLGNICHHEMRGLVPQSTTDEKQTTEDDLSTMTHITCCCKKTFRVQYEWALVDGLQKKWLFLALFLFCILTSSESEPAFRISLLILFLSPVVMPPPPSRAQQEDNADKEHEEAFCWHQLVFTTFTVLLRNFHYTSRPRTQPPVGQVTTQAWSRSMTPTWQHLLIITEEITVGKVKSMIRTLTLMTLNHIISHWYLYSESNLPWNPSSTPVA